MLTYEALRFARQKKRRREMGRLRLLCRIPAFALGMFGLCLLIVVSLKDGIDGSSLFMLIVCGWIIREALRP